jgi:two-component system, LuxR family, sensor kinase FixL
MQQQRSRRRGRVSTPDRLVDDQIACLLRAPIALLSGEILQLLAALGKRLRADRVTLWELGGRDLDPVHQWSRAGCAAHDSPVPCDDHPWLIEQLFAGRRIAFRTCATLPAAAYRERKLFARHGPRSAAILPIAIGDAPVAMLVAGTMREPRTWRSAAWTVLEHAGVVLANALERLRGHAAWLETEGRLSGVLEAAPDGILLARPAGRVELANGRATAIFLRTRQELRAERLQDLLAPAPDAPCGLGRTTIEALLASEAPLRLRARRGDGSVAPVDVTLRELRTTGEPLFCCGVRDASEDTRVHDEAARLRNELAFMGRTAMLAEMGAGIAHELNQPLTAILSNAETAERLLCSSRKVDTDELRDALGDVVKETRRAADVLGRMRDMLRPGEAERAPVDVAAVLVGVARRFREEAVARSIALSMEVQPRLAPVLGDAVQLEQVLMNLVLNAFDAMGEGGGLPRTITLRARASQPDGVAISVRDSGPGLASDALAHAFDAFFTTKARGLGMGLPISRSIVEAHGGRLLARNNAEGGATFEFHLPAATRRAAAVGKGAPS